MFVPNGYFYLPEILTWVTKLGAEGKLPRRLGFVHPGDVTDPLALSAEATARFVLGEMLAANAIPAEFIIFPSGLRLPVPAYYWSSESAAATMKTGKLDLNAIGYQNNLHTADVILPIDKVAAALGIRLIPLPEDLRSEPDDYEVRQATCRQAPEPPAATGRETRGADLPRFQSGVLAEASPEQSANDSQAPVADMPPAPDPGSPPTDELDEQKMTKWVTKLMQDQPDAPITKKGARALAVEGGLQDISDRGFEDRVWPDAIKASGYRRRSGRAAGAAKTPR